MIRRIAVSLAILTFTFVFTTATPTPTLSATAVDPCSGGTLGFWPMTEGSGNVVHDICNGYDGTFSQGVAWATDAEGPYLQFFLGDGPRVEVNAPGLSLNTSLTVELRMQAVGNNEKRVISQMLKPDGTRGSQRWILKLTGRQLEVWGETGSNRIPDSPFGSFPGGENNWTHVAFQINGNQVWLYYDGVLRASGTLNFPQTLRSLAAITEFGSGERIGGFAGKIQFVRISSGIRNDFLLTRLPENEPPTADADGPYQVGEGGSVILDGSSSSDPDGDPLTVEWDLDNDGTFETSGQTPTFSAAGRDGPASQTVVLKIYDDSDTCDTDETTVEILNVAPTVDAGPNQAVDEGDTVNFTGSGSDVPGDTLTFEWDFDYNGITFDVDATGQNASMSYSDGPDSVTVALRVIDDDGASTIDTLTVIVNNVAPTVDTPTITPDTSDEGGSVMSSATFSDPGVNDAPFTCTVNYGDGSGDLTDTASATTCTGPAHTYADNGSYSVTVSVTDKDGVTESSGTTHVVNNVPPTATFNAPTDVDEGSEINLSLTDPSDPSSADTSAGFEYALDCGDGSGYGPFGASNSAVCPTDDNGTRTVRGHIRDKDGGVTEYVASVTVNNVPPTATFINTSGDVFEGESATLAFSDQYDPSSADTAVGFLYSYDCTDNGAFEDTDTSAAAYDCLYLSAGTFTARGRIKDKDGGFSNYTVEVTVLTPQDATDTMIDDVQDLVDTGVLNQGQGNALTHKLDNIIAKLNQGKTKAAINQLEAFINQVTDLINNGVLSAAEGQPLIDTANRIIDSID
jgi:hypothetical protein